MLRNIVIMILIFLLCIISLNCNGNNKEGEFTLEEKEYYLKITINDSVLYASLIDSPATRDFIALLPLEIDLEDYAGTEKINYLEQKLSTKESPSGYKAEAGDITYYSPWGNLAIFYKDFNYASGLIYLGKIEKGIELLQTSSKQKAKFEITGNKPRGDK